MSLKGKERPLITYRILGEVGVPAPERDPA